LKTSMPRSEFLEHLRDALAHLYHADHLRNSRLVELFGLAGRFDRAAALRQILLESIESLRPVQGKEDGISRDWRSYESLFCCYVQQLTQQIVADQLCISPRQLRREQRAAVELLADRLWQEHVAPPTRPTADASTEGEPDLLGEMPWAYETLPNGESDLGEHLSEVIELTSKLATKHGVRVCSPAAPALPPVAMHPIFVKQALLSLVDAGIQQALGGTLQLQAKPSDATVTVSVSAQPAKRLSELSAGAQRNLAIARQLVVTAGGQLVVVQQPPDPLEAYLVLPAVESVPILVVDDNEDALQLYARYTASTRYRLVTTPNPDEIPALVRRHAPRAILLDIMMPQGNGWTVLGALRQSPLTRHIPIIVCTILPQEDLALSLGARAFVPKPVSRERFLAELDALDAPEVPESG
jgi:CheY-like chemotaxis protein